MDGVDPGLTTMAIYGISVVAFLIETSVVIGIATSVTVKRLSLLIRNL